MEVCTEYNYLGIILPTSTSNADIQKTNDYTYIACLSGWALWIKKICKNISIRSTTHWLKINYYMVQRHGEDH